MEIEITGLGDKGELSNERIGLQALRDCDLKYYIVFRTTFNAEKSTFHNISSSAYWFTPRLIKKGDKVVLYTKSGVDSSKINPDGSTTHFLYWGQTSALFNANTKDKGVVIINAKTWESIK